MSFMLALGLVSCQEPFSNDDILFLKALPSRHDLRFEVPREQGGGLRPAANRRAEFHDQAKKISDGLNSGIDGVLVSLERLVTENEPTLREDDRRVYGPFPDGDSRFLLTVTRTATETTIRPTSTSTPTEVFETYTFALVGQKLSSGDEWLPILVGRFVPTESLSEGIGQVLVDFEAARALGNDAHERGRFALGYDTRDSRKDLELVIDVPDGLFGLPFARPEAHYRFQDDGVGSVSFQFAFKTDVHEGDPTKSGIETLVIFARWRPDLFGRADVLAFEGDLPVPVLASECWSPSLTRVFFAASIPELGAPVGTEDDCAPEHRDSAFPSGT
ncbi:MAG: hypothetical protein HY791_25340 [Deltaproteobacteria bacterium]|nr:hypothetical protein [Deltaproteobacteria bacterium]